jgi:GNAT superfamily N-acetyltransferase
MIALSVRGLSTDYYSPAQIESAIKYIFGVDTQLVIDGTYHVAEIDGITVGCGGWSKRNTLYGSDQHKDSEDPLLDPKHAAARIRAFFVHPDYARKGVGRHIINVCEAEAKANGFTSFELGAPLPGIPLYTAMGYQAVTPTEAILPDGEVLHIPKNEEVVLDQAKLFDLINIRGRRTLDHRIIATLRAPARDQRFFKV